MPPPVLEKPVVLLCSAPDPVAVLRPPVVLPLSAAAPTAVLLPPISLVVRADLPNAVLLTPPLRPSSAFLPPAVLPLLSLSTGDWSVGGPAPIDTSSSIKTRPATTTAILYFLFMRLPPVR